MRKFESMPKRKMILLMLAGYRLETSDGRELWFRGTQQVGSPFRVAYLGGEKSYTPGNSWDCCCRIKDEA